MHYRMSSTLYRVHWSKTHYRVQESTQFWSVSSCRAISYKEHIFSTSPLFTVQESILSSPVCCARKRTSTFSVWLASWQRIPLFTSTMAASSAVQLLTVISLEVTKEDKETLKIKSGKRLVVFWRRFISARDESRNNCRTRKVQHSSNLTSQVHWHSLSFDTTRIPCLAGHCFQ